MTSPLNTGEEAFLSEVSLDILDEPELEVFIGPNGEYVEPPKKVRETDHYANLAEDIEQGELETIVDDLYARVEDDKDSSESWTNTCTLLLRELGLDPQDASRSSPFPGASNVCHPLLLTAVIDSHARAMRALLPPAGPVRIKIEGQVTQEKEQKAERVQKFMNWQCTSQIHEYDDVYNRVLFERALFGTSYMHQYYDPALKRPVLRHIPIDRFYAPYGATDLYSAPRYTERVDLFEQDVEQRMESGVYRKVDLPEPGAPLQSGLDSEKDNISGQHSTQTSAERRSIYEIYANVQFESLGDDRPLPYMIAIDADSKTVLSVRRRWDEEDPLKRRIVDHVIWRMFTSLGWFGIGIGHVLGSLAKTATAALRSLLDSANIANMPGGIRLKGSRVEGGAMMVQPMQWPEIDGANVDDVRKIAMPWPVNGPSPVLYQLLEKIQADGMSLFNSASQTITEASNNGPVGTTLALIEQGMVTQSADHRSLYRSQRFQLEIQARINAETLDDEETQEQFGDELVVYREDFDREVDILPVSDPNIWSEAQMLARDGEITKLVQQFPDLPWNKKYLAESILNRLHVDDPSVYFTQPQQAQPLDPVSEFQALITGQPVKAFPGQNHESHIAYLMARSSDAAYAQSMQVIQPQFMALVGEHMALQSRAEIEQQIGQPLPPPGQPVPPPVQFQISQAAAQVAQMLAQQRPIQPQQQDPNQGLVEAERVKQEAESRRADRKLELDESVKIVETQLKIRQQDIDTNLKMAQIASQERLALAKVMPLNPGLGEFPVPDQMLSEAIQAQMAAPSPAPNIDFRQP